MIYCLLNMTPYLVEMKNNIPSTVHRRKKLFFKQIRTHSHHMLFSANSNDSTRHFDPLTNGSFKFFTLSDGKVLDVLQTDRLNTLSSCYFWPDWSSRDTFLLRRADRPQDSPDEIVIIYPFVKGSAVPYHVRTRPIID